MRVCKWEEDGNYMKKSGNRAKKQTEPIPVKPQNKRWMHVTKEEISAYKARVCIKCGYFGSASTKKEGTAAYATCDYAIITGKMRPCNFFECQEKGVFEPRIKKGRGKMYSLV